MSPRAPLPDPAALARYEGLTLHLRGGMGDRPGERRFPGPPEAGGIELEAYAPYTAGDDLRHLDWTALGRLDQLLVRRYTAEREIVFHFLLDLSASMAVPEGAAKLAAAHELILVLAYVALAAGDAVKLAGLGGAPLESPVLRQRAAVRRLGDLLADTGAEGPLDLGDALEAYARRHPRPGAAVVVSDLMTDPTAVERGVQALRARHYGVLLLHVLDASELEPAVRLGQTVLRDAESSETHPVSLTPATLARYRDLLAAHLAALETLAARSETHYARLVAGAAVPDFVAGELARRGIVRRRRR